MDRSRPRKKKKSTKRIEIINEILTMLKSEDIFGVIAVETKDENKIKLFMYNVLLAGLKKFFQDRHPDYRQSTLVRKAKKSLIWEGNKKESIAPAILFGEKHYPDYVVEVENLRIAIEINMGRDGASIREGLGQSLVYSSDYDFVIYLLIDVSENREISKHFSDIAEVKLTNSIWEYHNIKFDVV